MRDLRNRFRRRPKDAGGEQWRGNLVKHNDMNDAYDTLGWKATRERPPDEYIWLSDCTVPNTTNGKRFVCYFIPRTDQLYPGGAF